MANRATPEAVRGVIEWQDGDNGPVIPLPPFIRQANILVDWLSGQDTDSDLSNAALIEIEVLLAAHFYQTQRDLQAQSQSTDGASSSNQGVTNLGFEGSHHGQAALRLDVTGNLTKRELEARNGKRVATTTWIGYQDHSQDPY